MDRAAYGPEIKTYLDVQEALAADKLAPAKEAAKAGAAAAPADFRKPLETIAGAADLKGARAAFHDLSKAAIPFAEARAKAADAKMPALILFECPMAPPFGKWLQASDPLANPYWGAEMLRCGAKVATIGGK